MNAPHPRTLGPQELSERFLPRTPATIIKDCSRKPWSLPPFIRVPGVKGPLWLESDVLAWLEAHRVQTRPAPDFPSDRRLIAKPGKRGQPSNAEKLEAQRRGITVPELRRRAASGELGGGK